MGPTIASSQIIVLDGSNDITSLIDWTTFDLTMVLTKEKGGLKFDIVAPQAPTLPTHMPALSDTIQVFYTIYDAQGNPTTRLIFGGTVITLEQVIDAGTLQRFHVTCSDWGYIFDSKLVKKTYALMDPADIVADIVAHFAPSGFTTNHVQRGNFLVSVIQFNYQQPTKALESLAKQIGWDWYIDPVKDVHFFFADTTTGTTEKNPAPFLLDDTGGNIQWPTLDVSIDLANMKNSVFVIGGSYTKIFALSPSPTEFAPIDIYTTVAGTFVYPLAYPYDESTLTVTLNGVGQAIGTDLTTDPSSVQVLYNSANRFLRFTTDPGSGKQIIVQGSAKVPILAHVSNPTTIAEFGEFQDVISDSNILSVQQAQARGLAEIEQFGHPVYDVTFKTISPLSNLLFIGQTIKLNSAKFGVSNYPLVIRRIECIARTPTQLEYQVEAMGSDTVTFTDIMLTLLQQSSGQTQTDASTVLQVLLPTEEEITVTDAVLIITGTAPYSWGPTPSPLQSAEGGAMYGSFGFGSEALGGGLPYPNDPIGASKVAARWGFFTWH
jgi:hypothetical protein